MAKVYTDSQDELIITNVLKQGLKQPTFPKWTVLRLALARSLRINTPPDEAFDRRLSASGGGEYSLEQLTGQGKEDNEDTTLLVQALLSEYHSTDLFDDEEQFVKLLQRHMRRGLHEFRSGWMESHDFHNFLLHELFGDSESRAAMPAGKWEERLERALLEIGIESQITDSNDGPRLSRYLVKLNDPNDYSVLLKGVDKLNFILGLGDASVFVTPTTESKVAALDVPRPSTAWKSVDSSQLVAWVRNAPQDWKLPIFVGQTVTGEPLAFDLAKAPHLLVAGTTGSGKSVCLHAIILSLILGGHHANTKLLLIDPKRVEFAGYAKLPSLWDKVLTNTTDVLVSLKRLIDEMNSRETAFANLGVRDIDDPKVPSGDFPRIVVFVEELADLLIQSTAIEEPLIRLAQKARATGIHLVIATQRPDAKILSGLLRSNIPSRIGLTVQKSSESRIILDETGAEKLLGRGDMLVRMLGYPTIRGHGVFIDNNNIPALIGSKRKG